MNHNNTLAVWLHDAGYYTAFTGKYMNGYSCSAAIPPGWSHWQGICGNPYMMYNYRINDGGTLITYGESAADYQTDVLADRAEDSIDEAVTAGKPLFLKVAPTVVHGGNTGAASRAAACRRLQR
jgi:hypothetical protein